MVCPTRPIYIRQSARGAGVDHSSATIVGVLEPVLPAARAARVDVVQALRSE